jgi:predicted amidohydrolase YtcJ
MLNLADVVFRVGRAYGMTADRGIYQAVAVKDGRITAVGRSRDELSAQELPGSPALTHIPTDIYIFQQNYRR